MKIFHYEPKCERALISDVHPHQFITMKIKNGFLFVVFKLYNQPRNDSSASWNSFIYFIRNSSNRNDKWNCLRLLFWVK